MSGAARTLAPDALGAPAAPAAAADGPPTAPSAGWRAHLQLRFEAVDGATRLTRRHHEGPLVVQRTFHPETPRGAPGARGPCHAYLIHPPGGLVGGDQLFLTLVVAPEAHALLTTPAAGKFYRRGAAGPARLTQSLAVRGRLEWLPQENIFYPDCAAEVCTQVHLAGEGRFIGWEVGCLGLPAIARGLGEGRVWQGFELYRDGRPLLLERQRITAECLRAPWGLRGHAAFGSCLAYPVRESVLELARARAAQLADAELTLACTLVDEVLCCRGFALRADRLRAAFAQLWATLRPLLFGRAAVPPRIWAT
ncbi:MAG TPA: urease accessory protein UreD [Steroidobacteraceae bacterium]|nr:urease accessory protein UreD [Steroidobacteraceae bacterium]